MEENDFGHGRENGIRFLFGTIPPIPLRGEAFAAVAM